MFFIPQKCWQYLVDSNENWALICEDDIRFSDRAYDFIISESWIPSEINLIRMNANVFPQTFSVSNVRFQIGGHSELIQPFYPPALVSACYLISRKYAKEALASCQVIYQPVDEYLSAYRSSWAKAHPFYALNPAIATFSESSIVTTIGKNRDYEKKNLVVQVNPKRIFKKLKYKLKGMMAQKDIILFK